jgi:hypothetical protein
LGRAGAEDKIIIIIVVIRTTSEGPEQDRDDGARDWLARRHGSLLSASRELSVELGPPQWQPDCKPDLCLSILWLYQASRPFQDQTVWAMGCSPQQAAACRRPERARGQGVPLAGSSS